MPDRVWTLQGLGTLLAEHIAEGKDVVEKVDSMYTCLIAGNSHPSMRATVQKHDDWINGVNRFVWIVITAMVGLILTNSCALLAVLYEVMRRSP